MDRYWDMFKKEKLHRNIVIFLVAIAFLLGLIVPRSLSLFQNAAGPKKQERKNDQRLNENWGQDEDDYEEDEDEDDEDEDDEDEDDEDDEDDDTVTR